MIEGMSAVIEHPIHWSRERWTYHLNVLVAFLISENMAQAQKLTKLDPPEMIAAIESFILALISLDESVMDHAEAIRRREHVLNAIKGMQNYAKMIQMDRIEVIKIPKTPH